MYMHLAMVGIFLNAKVLWIRYNLQSGHMWHPVSLLKDWPFDIQHASMVTLGSVIVASVQFGERWQPTARHEEN